MRRLTWSALSMASGRLLLNKSWVIELEPRQSVERRLIVVDTVALVVAFVADEASTDVLSGPPLADTFTEELLIVDEHTLSNCQLSISRI